MNFWGFYLCVKKGILFVDYLLINIMCLVLRPCSLVHTYIPTYVRMCVRSYVHVWENVFVCICIFQNSLIELINQFKFIPFHIMSLHFTQIQFIWFCYKIHHFILFTVWIYGFALIYYSHYIFYFILLYFILFYIISYYFSSIHSILLELN